MSTTKIIINTIIHAILVIGGCYYFSMQIRAKFPKKKKYTDIGALMSMRYSHLFTKNFNYAIYDSATDAYILYNYDISTGAIKLIKTETFNVKDYHYSVPLQMFVKKAMAPIYKDNSLTFRDNDKEAVQLHKNINFDNESKRFVSGDDGAAAGICKHIINGNQEVTVDNYKKFYGIPNVDDGGGGDGHNKDVIPNIYFECSSNGKGLLKRCMEDEYFEHGSCKKRKSSSGGGGGVARSYPPLPAAYACSKDIVTENVNVNEQLHVVIHYERERYDDILKKCVPTTHADLKPYKITVPHLPYYSMADSFHIKFDKITDEPKLIQLPSLNRKYTPLLDGTYYENNIKKIPTIPTIFYHDKPYTLKVPNELSAAALKQQQRSSSTTVRIEWNADKTACFTMLGDVILDATIVASDYASDPITYNVFIEDDDFNIEPSLFEFIKINKSRKYKYFSTSDLYKGTAAAADTRYGRIQAVLPDMPTYMEDVEYNKYAKELADFVVNTAVSVDEMKKQLNHLKRIYDEMEKIHASDDTVYAAKTKTLNDAIELIYQTYFTELQGISIDAAVLPIDELDRIKYLYDEMKKIRTPTNTENAKCLDKINVFEQHIETIYTTLYNSLVNYNVTGGSIDQLDKQAIEVTRIYDDMKKIRNDLTHANVFTTVLEKIDAKIRRMVRFSNFIHFRVEYGDDTWTPEDAERQTGLLEKYYSDLTSDRPPTVDERNMYVDLSKKCKDVEIIERLRHTMRNIPEINISDPKAERQKLIETYDELHRMLFTEFLGKSLVSDASTYRHKLKILDDLAGPFRAIVKYTVPTTDILQGVTYFTDTWKNACKLENPTSEYIDVYNEKMDEFRMQVLNIIESFRFDPVTSTKESVTSDLQEMNRLWEIMTETLQSTLPDNEERYRLKYIEHESHLASFAYDSVLSTNNKNDLTNAWNAAIAIRVPTATELAAYNAQKLAIANLEAQRILINGAGGSGGDDDNLPKLDLDIRMLETTVWAPQLQQAQQAKLDELHALRTSANNKLLKYYDDLTNYPINTDKNMTVNDAKAQLVAYATMLQNAENLGGPPNNQAANLFAKKMETMQKILEDIEKRTADTNDALKYLKTFKYSRNNNINDLRTKINSLRSTIGNDALGQNYITKILNDLTTEDDYIKLCNTTFDRYTITYDEADKLLKSIQNETARLAIIRPPTASEQSKINNLNKNLNTELDYYKFFMNTPQQPLAHDDLSTLEKQLLNIMSDYIALNNRRLETPEEKKKYVKIVQSFTRQIAYEKKYLELLGRRVESVSTVETAEYALKMYMDDIASIEDEYRKPTPDEKKILNETIDKFRTEILRLEYNKVVQDVPFNLADLDTVDLVNKELGGLDRRWVHANHKGDPTAQQTDEYTVRRNLLMAHVFNEIFSFNVNKPKTTVQAAEKYITELNRKFKDAKKIREPFTAELDRYNSDMDIIKAKYEKMKNAYNDVTSFNEKKSFATVREYTTHLQTLKQAFKDAKLIRNPENDEEPKYNKKVETINKIIQSFGNNK